MKSTAKFFLAGGLALIAAFSSSAQQPVISVGVSQINVGGTVTGTTPLTFAGGATFTTPNESFGAAGTRINIGALAVGTNLISSFTYSFFVNGVSIGVTSGPVTPPNNAVVQWTPPQPGSYFITVTATDGTNTATSLPVRYFATGTVVNSPVTNTIVPQGSSVVLKADATVGLGFIRHIQFYDNGVAIGAPDTTLPYSLIYTPPGAPGSPHSITAQATDNTGAVLPLSPAITLNVVTAITPLPTSVISTPANNVAIAIPTGGTSIPVTVDGHSTSGVIGKVELYIDGVLFGTKIGFPYTFTWTPTVVGTYNLVALTYDDKNNVVASTTSLVATSTPAPTSVIIAAPPSVTVTSPSNGGTVTGGSPVALSASATDTNGFAISGVQFFVDSVFMGQATSPSSGSTYTVTATLSQKKDSSGTVIPSVVTALATNSVGISGVSPGVSVTVTSGGSGGGAVIGIPPTVSLTAPTASTQLSVNAPVFLGATAADSDGNIISVQFFANGTSVGTSTAYPYSGTWTPTSLGSYAITAKATDNSGNAVTSSAVTVSVVDPSPGQPTVSVTSPTSGANFPSGVSQTLSATAAASSGAVASVQFYVNGQPFGTPIITSPFNATWTPASAGSYTITARVIDFVGKQVTSAPVTVTVGSNASPAVLITSPAASSTISAGTPVNLAANATDSDGSITSVRFLANGVVAGAPVTTAPFRTSWTPSASGTYTVIAQATDNSGNVTTSSAITVTVGGNQAPTVSITNPGAGTITSVGTGATPVTVTASASDPDGVIGTVQFYANGSAIGSKASPPYSITWTPTAEGIYQLTAVASDNAFASTTSTAVPLLAVATGGAASVNVYTGIYVAGSEVGKFAAVALGGKMATFIARSTQGPVKNYYYPGLTLGSSGGFTRSSGTTNLISGTVTGGSVGGTLGATGLFSGSNPALTLSSSATPFPMTGYFTGSLSGRPTSSLSAIVGVDGSIMVHMSDGAFSDVGDAKVDSTGSFLLTTASGNSLNGKVDPTSGFITGTLTVIGSGAFTAPATGSLTSGGTFSDGVLKGLSTRSFVGTGDSILIAGFIVDGTVSKQVLIRGIGPSLAGVGTPLTNPVLQLYSGSTQIASNDNWATPSSSLGAITSATLQVGLGALSAASLDSVIVTTLAPGAYTAQLSGVGGTSGNGLVEIYDLDTLAAFSPQKVRAISTRGFVGSAGNELIAGFIVSGNTAKKVLIQAAGPAIATSVSGTLLDPVLRIVNMATGKTVRENDNWEMGNDGVVMIDAVNRSGATPLAAGSKDAAILISLPPGVYTAVVSGNTNSTGIALVQVYEVP